MLKADLHLHVQGDPRHPKIKHTAHQLIDYASKLKFEVLAITNHNQVFYNQTLANYAESRNILLIPGIEKTIQGNEVLIYNITQEQANQIKTFNDLKKIQEQKNILTIAPHPFFLLPDCLGKNLERYIYLFDAIEYSHFYHKLINRNKKAAKIAQKYNKPLIGTSDVHHFFQINHTYTLINAKKDTDSIINAIKNKKCRTITQSLSTVNFLKVPFNVFLR
ncbi:PHP domain-containing protein [Candidatus Woesearchaeota archaeon]|nr:PHP domain-containing protein [Candidatus Woesearchaeota archaeon]